MIILECRRKGFEGGWWEVPGNRLAYMEAKRTAEYRNRNSNVWEFRARIANNEQEATEL